jgi:hypothetical protein
MSVAPLNLYDLTREELHALFARWEFSPVHVARLWRYLYWECVDSLAAMPELPAKVHTRLAAETRLGVLGTALATDSSDGFTRKYLLALDDAEKIETVLMRYTGRVTACISSQVGCAMGCVFCATGQMGYTRHLTPGEIVAQAVHVQRTPAAQAFVTVTKQAAGRRGAPAQRRADGHGRAVAQLRGGDEGRGHPARSQRPRARGRADHPQHRGCRARHPAAGAGKAPGAPRPFAALPRPRPAAPRSCRRRRNGRSTSSWPPAAPTAKPPAGASSMSGR